MGLRVASEGQLLIFWSVELLLNLVWLATAFSLFALLWRQLRRNAGAGRVAQRYLSAAVLSFLLLPVISMTDDLHAMTMMAEGERAGGKMVASQDDAPHSTPLMFLPSADGAAPLKAPLFCLGTLDIRSIGHNVLPLFFPSHSDRAPPLD